MLGIVEQWGLQVGSKVAWQSYWDGPVLIGEVVKITQPGMVDVVLPVGCSIPKRFNSNGCERVRLHPSKIFQLTPEIEAKIERDRLIAEFSRVAEKGSKHPNQCTTEQIEQIKVLLNLLCHAEKRHD